ncbi:hypothetical protein AAHH88_00580 [Candidatus Hodgkinia cicadicola]
MLTCFRSSATALTKLILLLSSGAFVDRLWFEALSRFRTLEAEFVGLVSAASKEFGVLILSANTGVVNSTSLGANGGEVVCKLI